MLKIKTQYFHTNSLAGIKHTVSMLIKVL